MGRVKSLMIKNAARELHETIGDFSGNFEHNKKLLKGTVPYKSVRNKIAGGIVKLATKEKQRELREKQKELKENKEAKNDDNRTTEENNRNREERGARAQRE